MPSDISRQFGSRFFSLPPEAREVRRLRGLWGGSRDPDHGPLLTRPVSLRGGGGVYHCLDRNETGLVMVLNRLNLFLRFLAKFWYQIHEGPFECIRHSTMGNGCEIFIVLLDYKLYKDFFVSYIITLYPIRWHRSMNNRFPTFLNISIFSMYFPQV